MRRVHVVMTPGTAALLWMVCNVFAHLPSPTPRARARALSMAKQFHAITGPDYKGGDDISDAGDTLAVAELEDHLDQYDKPAREYKLAWLNAATLQPLKDTLPAEFCGHSPGSAFYAAHEFRLVPNHVYYWLREAQPGDKLKVLVQERRYVIQAEVKTISND